MFEYVCPKCDKVVLPAWDTFEHPHLGLRPCYVCPDCGTMVYLRDERDKTAV